MKRIAFVLLVSLSAIAAEAPKQTTRATSAIVFKNGLAFITREGNVSFVDGRATIAPLPEAFLGTLWVGANGRAIDELHASTEPYDTTRNAVSIADLLEANVGKMATIRVGDRDYNGTLIAPATSEPAIESGLVLINVDGRVHAFPRAAVQSVSFAETPASTLRARASRSLLALHSKGAEGSVPVTISYLRNGVSWMPEYAIALVDDAHAKLTMQATLIDDSEELRDTNVRFAVGFPNFEYAGVQSPLTPQQSLQQFLNRLNGAGRYDNSNTFSNVMTQNVMVNTNTGSSPELFTPQAPAFGEASEDLFFYERANVTLAAGERAAYPILSATVPLRHVYEWDVAAETESTRNDPEQQIKPGQVWHSISLTNSGTTPWTTGPAFVTANGKPLAQDLLSYTAAGASGTVRLTIATDVSVAREEKEVARRRHAPPSDADSSRWTEISVEGTLSVRNYKREAITLSIDKSLVC